MLIICALLLGYMRFHILYRHIFRIIFYTTTDQTQWDESETVHKHYIEICFFYSFIS